MPAFVEIDFPETRSLLAQARAGDAAAFGELCHAYEARLLRQAVTLCGDASLAEDLAQETLLAAWKNLRRYNGRCQFFTWLCAILLNRFRNTVRRKRPVPFSVMSSGEHSGLEQAPDAAPGPDQAAALREQAALLRRCVQSLPVKHQEVIHLRFYVDDSLEGIAAALGCSVGTVKSRLFNALEKLRVMRALNHSAADTGRGARIL
jgi:RNA polymerase sigma-70 factor (ECF subfamily)